MPADTSFFYSEAISLIFNDYFYILTIRLFFFILFYMQKQLIILDCDGTCYPTIPTFNGTFKAALKATARDWQISEKDYTEIGMSVRGRHPGMMNFILALCGGNMIRFAQFTQDWCNRLDYSLIQPNPMLGHILRHTKLPVCILTNNCKLHLDHVWRRLFPFNPPHPRTFTIENTYDGHWFHPKQDPDGFRRFCAMNELTPTSGLVLDDSIGILKVAQQAGLSTRLVSPQRPLALHLRELERE